MERSDKLVYRASTEDFTDCSAEAAAREQIDRLRDDIAHAWKKYQVITRGGPPWNVPRS